jgi:hypothetical protein
MEMVLWIGQFRELLDVCGVESPSTDGSTLRVVGCKKVEHTFKYRSE